MKNLIVFWFVFCAAVNCDESDEPNYVTRSSWGARSPDKQQIYYSEIPTSAIIYHSGTPLCYMMDKCKDQIRKFQDYDMDTKKWGDIRANFLISEDGDIYEGRGWMNVSVNSNGFYSKSIEICVIGNFVEIKPSPAALNATRMLLNDGVSMGFLNSSYKLYIQRDTRYLPDVPEKLDESMKEWPHRNPSPIIVARSLWDTVYNSPFRLPIVTKIPSTVLISYIPMSNCVTVMDCKSLFDTVKIRDPKTWNTWNPIYTNFYIVENGNVYEDAGWSNADLHDGESIQIILIANFTDRPLNTEILDAIKNLLALGVAMGALSPTYNLYEHMDNLINFKLPKNIREILKEWPNWREKPNIIERSDWGGEIIPAEELLIRYGKFHIVPYDITTLNCISIDTCKATIKNIQDWYKSQNSMEDMPYNFLIDANGNLYEGTGWHSIKSQDLQTINNFNICFVGNFEDQSQISVVFDTMKRLLNYGVAIAIIDPNYTVYGLRHSQLISRQIGLDASKNEMSNWHGIPSIVMRRGWNAREPMEQIPFAGQASMVMIFGIANVKCDNFNDCKRAVNLIQDYQMNVEKSSDIKFNFLIDENGRVYEGRGWNLKGFYSIEYTRDIVEICVTGDYEDLHPNPKIINAVQYLLEYGVREKKITPTYKIYEHRDDPYSLGKKLQKIIRAMPHFQMTPEIMGRSSWNATETDFKKEEIFTEIPSVVFISQYTLANRCYTPEQCTNAVKNIQKLILLFGHWNDISYHFLIGGDGYVYMGRGWDFKSPQENVFRNRSIEIAFIGDYYDYRPNPYMLTNLKTLLDFGVQMGSLHPNYILYSADVSYWNLYLPRTAYDEIKSWTHWRTIPSIIDRSEWDPETPKKNMTRFPEIPNYVVLTRSQYNGCNTRKSCLQTIKMIQTSHMNVKNTSDIEYNFLIGEDGNVYEGLGWSFHGTQLKQYPTAGLEIYIIGSYHSKPESTIFTVTQNLLAYGVATGHLNPSYNLYLDLNSHRSRSNKLLFKLI